MSLPDAYAVNQQTHKQWLKRRKLVDRLALWVYLHLDLTKRKRDESKSEGEGKSYQYVYEHLAVGKMKFPVENKDPLFTHATYKDLSMINMLKTGLYPKFQAQVQWAIQDFHDYNPNKTRDIAMEDALHGLSNMNKARIREVIQEFEKTHTSHGDAWKENQVIGLVMRYRCMGGFSDNLHGSVPPSWGESIPAFVECFASPFNHKFTSYYSIYEEDHVFGSQGSFFSMIHRAGGVLQEGCYEINPPWNNEMY
jgi:hypothetical protein